MMQIGVSLGAKKSISFKQGAKEAPNQRSIEKIIDVRESIYSLFQARKHQISLLAIESEQFIDREVELLIRNLSA